MGRTGRTWPLSGITIPHQLFEIRQKTTFLENCSLQLKTPPEMVHGPVPGEMIHFDSRTFSTERFKFINVHVCLANWKLEMPLKKLLVQLKIQLNMAYTIVDGRNPAPPSTPFMSLYIPGGAAFIPWTVFLSTYYIYISSPRGSVTLLPSPMVVLLFSRQQRRHGNSLCHHQCLGGYSVSLGI